MQAKRFVDALLDGRLPVPSGIENRPSKRFAVYRNNVTLGLVRALTLNFPVVEKLLGQVYFAGLAREFVLQHPPQSPLMFEFGSHFPEFLEGQPDLQNYPYLGDVAKFEILKRSSYHAADHESMNAAELAAVPGELLGHVRFSPHPSLRLVKSRFAIGSIARHNLEQTPLSVAVTKPEGVIIARKNLDVSFHVVDPAVHDFFAALAGGATLAEACEAPQQDFDLEHCMSLALTNGFFSSIILPGETA